MEFIPEFLNLLGMCHVNKSLPVVGLTLLVNGHVEEVVAAEEPLVNLVEQDVLRESIRDVPDHQRVLVGVCLVLGLQSFDVACVSGLLQFAAVQVEWRGGVHQVLVVVMLRVRPFAGTVETEFSAVPLV